MYNLNEFEYSYSTKKSLKKLTLKNPIVLNEKETIAIVGPSGAGKSTLLKILKGLIPQYQNGRLEGSVLFNGEPLGGDHFLKNLEKILYLFQNPFTQVIFPDVEEEFLFSMENFNFSDEQIHEKLAELDKLFNISKFFGRKTNELSHGECQKLVLASLLAIGPEVLLLDEPTAFLDPDSRKDFYKFLKELKKDKTIVIVDHHIDEIGDLVDRYLHVNEEGLITEGFTELKTESLKLENIEIPFEVGNTVIGLNNVSFGYSDKKLLYKNLNLQFCSGEVVCIKGGNGEGKSTLFKLLSGILEPIEGENYLYISGKKIKRSEYHKKIGIVFQNPESHFYFDTIKEEIEQSFKIQNIDLKKQLLDAFFTNLDQDRSPFLLSEGEKRRLSILMTIFLDKKIIFYDEPTFGQDQKSIKEIENIIKAIKKTGVIQVFISHNEKFINNVSTKILELKNGVLHASNA